MPLSPDSEQTSSRYHPPPLKLSHPTLTLSYGFLSLYSHLHSQLQDLDAECLRRTELETKLKGLQGFVELMRTVYEQVRNPRGGRGVFDSHYFQPMTSQPP